MVIDTTINLGNLLTALLAIVAFAVAFTKIGGRLDLLSLRVKALEDSLKGHGDLLQRLVIAETRQSTHGQLIATMQKDLSDLRRGQGFIRGQRSSVDGRYPPEDEQT